MINRRTGAPIDGFSEYAQRVVDVLSTPIGSRVKRPRFGSRVPDMLGRSSSDGNSIRLQVWAAQAFNNPENGISDGELVRMHVRITSNGYELSLILKYDDVTNEVIL